MKKVGLRADSDRPLSWCIERCRMSQPADSSIQDSDKREDGQDIYAEHNVKDGHYGHRVLARSTSYQALHSALARLYRLDDFALEKIGQGFFSEVYKARHLVTGEIMVLKMNKLFSNRHNMLREVELMNRLHHYNILSYYGVCIHEGQVHALTQYINGGSLDTLLQNLRIELHWPTRVSLALDIARGMTYLHSRRVFHRDLTSTNVLIKRLRENGRLKLRAVIADFGLAAPIPQDKCVRLRQVGSPYWMAPEVINGHWYDHRVDVFSFGIIVCEIIARCDADPDVLPRTHNFGVHYLAFSYMCQPDCPPAFLEIAFQCVQIDPDSRPSFQELTKKLERLLYHLLVERQAATPSPYQRKVRVCHRRSLSDESFALMKASNDDALPLSSQIESSAGTPQEVLERMGEADPYFQPSSATVNPFNQVKLPAKSQIIVQDGGRFCHSMPDVRNFSRYESPSLPSLAHLASSDTSLCHLTTPSHTHVNCQFPSYFVNNPRIDADTGHQPAFDPKELKMCQCSSSSTADVTPNLRKISDDRLKSSGDCKCFVNSSSHSRKVHSSSKLLKGIWPRDTPLDSSFNLGNLSHNDRLDESSVATVRRRGSGESGFFSVEDETLRISTPELCLSCSELSSTSFLSLDDEAHFLAHRSPSVFTDSSEDLSSLGCCNDLASLQDPDDCSIGPESKTDIKAIVEFFERGYGSMKSRSEADKKWLSLTGSNLRRKDNLVPLLKKRFSPSGGGFHGSHEGSVYRMQWPASSSKNMGMQLSGDFSRHLTKERAQLKSELQRGSRLLDKKGSFQRIKDKPKLYITEGTVRAKRNIFESK